MARKENSDVRFALAVSSLETSAIVLEGLSATRAALQAITIEEIREIDAKRKEARESIKAALVELADCPLACKAASPVGAAPSGSDDTTAKRYSRRRTWLKASLQSAYPDYGFKWEERRFVPTFEGDAETREARKIMATVQDWKDLGSPSDVKALVTSLKQANNVTKAESKVVPVYAPEHAGLFAAVAARVQGITEIFAGQVQKTVEIEALQEEVKTASVS